MIGRTGVCLRSWLEGRVKRRLPLLRIAGGVWNAGGGWEGLACANGVWDVRVRLFATGGARGREITGS